MLNIPTGNPWSNSCYDQDDAYLEGEECTVTLENIALDLMAGQVLTYLTAQVDMRHDGDGWEITGVAYAGDYQSHHSTADWPNFDAKSCRSRKSDVTLTDMVDRAVLKACEESYQDLADEATSIAKSNMEQ